MIFVPYDEPDDPEWQEWRAKTVARRTLLEQSFRFDQRPQIDESLYKAMRKFLMRRFRDKCAYCETPISRYTVDIEHYRPKGRVTDVDRKLVRITDAGGIERDHPGYYWLAYEWKNLLPSCEFCNRKRYHEEQDASWGKETCFPVEAEVYAWSPIDGGETVEKPLLIHPRFDDPGKHLTFVHAVDPETYNPICTIGHKDRRGEITIRVLGLNDERLNRLRVDAYEKGYGKMAELFKKIESLKDIPTDGQVAIRQSMKRLKEEINRIWAGWEPYSAFGRLGIEQYRGEVRDNFDSEIRVPLPV